METENNLQQANGAGFLEYEEPEACRFEYPERAQDELMLPVQHESKVFTTITNP